MLVKIHPSTTLAGDYAEQENKTARSVFIAETSPLTRIFRPNHGLMSIRRCREVVTTTPKDETLECARCAGLIRRIR